MGPGKGVVKDVEGCHFRFLVAYDLKVDSVSGAILKIASYARLV